MKKGFILILGLLLFACQTNSHRGGSAKIATFEDSTSYALGADIGENLMRDNIDLNYDIFLSGIIDAYETKDVQLDKKQRRQVMMNLQNKLREKAKLEVENNLKAADEFIKNNKTENSEVKETPTGLQYRVIKEGDGDSPGPKDRVKVHYSGRLIDGTVFDSSNEDEPSMFYANQVIRGWTEGLQLMKVGAKFELFIHPKLGYGTRKKSSIPPNSLLIFELELLEIVEKK
tara:strand:- start:130 stop:819 length:690 start_codon:yes stop_codon:yes gene_type:complete